MKKKLLTSLFLLFCQYLCIQMSAFDKDGLCYYLLPDLSSTDVYCAGVMWNATNKENIVIPSTVEFEGTTYNVTTVGGGAFAFNTYIKSLTLSEGITTIGSEAFLNCRNLAKLTLPSTLTTVGSSAFSSDYVLPANITNSSTTVTDLTQYGLATNFTETDGFVIFDQALMAYRGTSTEITIPSDALAIGAYAFQNSSVKSVTIPSTLTYIGNYAFYNAKDLTTVNTENATGLTTICERAFYNCTSLNSFTFPSSVTSVDKTAFTGCYMISTGLLSNSVNVDINSVGATICSEITTDGFCLVKEDLVKYVGQGGDITIPSNVTSIGTSVFANNSTITSVTVPSGVTSIPDYAFQESSALKKVTLQGNVTSIGDHAFSGCAALESITLPSSLTYISSYAFSSCTALKSIELPEGLLTIGQYAFQFSGLTSAKLPKSLTGLSTFAFSYCKELTKFDFSSIKIEIPSGLFCQSSKLAELTGTENITSISSQAFAYTALTSFEIGSNVTSISDGAFRGWSKTGLTVNSQNAYYTIDNGVMYNKAKTAIVTVLPTVATTYTIPATVTAILGYAFENCGDLTSITVPLTIQSIGSYAFGSLKDVYVNSYTPLSLSTSHIININAQPTLHVPAGRASVYQNAKGWKNFTNIVDDMPFNETVTSGTCGNGINWNLNYMGQLTISLQEGWTGANMPVYSATAAPWYAYSNFITHIVVDKGITPSVRCFYGLNNVKYLELPSIGTNYYVSTYYHVGYAFGSIFSMPESASRSGGGSNYSGYTYTDTYATSIPSTLDTLVINCNPNTENFSTTTVNTTTTTSSNVKTTVSTCYTTKGLSSIKHLYLNDVTSFDNFNATTVNTLFPNLKEVKVTYHGTAMKSGMFSEWSNLSYLSIPRPGAGNKAYAESFGSLFTGTTAGDNNVKVTQTGLENAVYIPATLKEVVIQDTCTSIPDNCFQNCTMLEKVTLPRTMLGVGSKAFYNCFALKELHSDNGVPPVAYDDTFTGINKLTCSLYVPTDSRDKYKKATGWKYFTYIEDDADACSVIITKNIQKAGQIIGSTHYAIGETATLEALANEGYTFTEWQENGTQISTERVLTWTANASRDLTAVFTPKSNPTAVGVNSSAKGVIFTWTPETDADTYNLKLFADAEKTEACAEYTLDADGKVVSGGLLAKSPFAGGTKYTMSTTMSSTTLSADIEGIDATSHYYYTITSVDSEGQILNVFVGDFGANSPTDIQSVDASDTVSGKTIYDLSGRRVSQPKSGLYIIDGKKTVVR